MILVTGADGIVGRAVCGALRSAREEFLPVVRRRRAFTPANAHVADLTAPGSLDALRDGGVRAIVHLAAAVPHSAHYPDSTLSADLTIRMDQTVRDLQEGMNVPVVYMSTCGLYDRLSSATKFEDDPSQIRVESPYFSAKMRGEKLFSDGGNAAVLRLAAPVGPGLKPGLVVSRFISAARAGKAIQIWGSGSREQNFVDVRDVAALVLKAVADPKPCTLNVAGVAPTTMVELARVVIAAVGKGTLDFAEVADPREGETARYSIAKAREFYGWVPVLDLAASCGILSHENFEGNA